MIAMTTALHTMSGLGQSPWIDQLSRTMLTDGTLRRYVDLGVRGVTTNPAILRKALEDQNGYDQQLRQVLPEYDDDKEVFLALARTDVQHACDLLARYADPGKTGNRRDGWVSLEVDPAYAADTDATVAEATRLHHLVDRPNFYVKIPGTAEGMPAIEETIAHGIPVNVTLLFSLERHRQAAEAYIRGLRRFVGAGGDPASVASVASFFVSRIDTEADRRLAEVGGPPDLRGALAVANAKMAYQSYVRIFSGSGWQDLAAAGATPQYCLWASTSTKNPDYRDVRYVEELLGPDTVTTMPPATIDAFVDHGAVQARLATGAEEAALVIDRFGRAGVDYDDVTATLERDGVRAFADSFHALLEGIRRRRADLLQESSRR
jgi:transaldolase